MQSEGVQSGFDELRDPVDLRSLPMDKLVRIVYLVNESGPVIRWLLPDDPDVQSLLGGINHDHLERGEGHGVARSGWLRKLKAGVRVTP
jgi:hypothetical protein